MCAMPECDVPVDRRMIRTGVPGTTVVLLGMCPICDTRHCGWNGCGMNVPDRTTTRCPHGHPL
jgi:hypothetical protein